MPIEVKMPRMSLTMEVGSIVQWLKAPGDRVEKGEDLAEIETDKVNVALEAPASGYLRALLVEPGVAVPCDSAIALLTATADEPLYGDLRLRSGPATADPLPRVPRWQPTPTAVGSTGRDSDHGLRASHDHPIPIADEGAIQPATVDVVPATRPQSPYAAMTPQCQVAPQSEAPARAHVNASPAAKNLAKHLGVDLARVAGTGPGGRIGLEDVQRAADAHATPASSAGAPQDRGRDANPARSEPTAVGVVPAPGAHSTGVDPLSHIRPQSEARPLSKMRAAIAQRMTAALAAPQFTVRRRADMTAALRVRQSRPAADGGRALGVIDLIHFAVTRALLAHPEVNASFHAGQSPEQGAIAMHAGVDLGIALALPDGLIVPVIRGAHAMGLRALAAERARLQEEARAGHLPASALGGATFTVSNLGTFHVDDFTAIVTPPEVAILAVGQVQETVVARNGGIHIVPLVALTVTADHRALDGAQVARFLDTVATNLDHLETLP